MHSPAKLGIAGLITMVVTIIFGFLLFPEFIKTQIIKMVNLKPGNDIREMFLDVPFGLDFNIYIFSVQNPDAVQKGAKPELKEYGPFCYEEWKKKINISDNEDDDTITYQPVDTFYERHGLAGCADLNTEVTIPHPLILGMVNTVGRAKPGATSLLNKAIKSIFKNPTSLFITVKAKDLLFDGVSIPCGVKDFAGKAICTTLKNEPSIKHITEDELAFSFFWPKNGTAGKQMTALRGTKDFHDVGRIIKYDGASKMNVWNVRQCDEYRGTDGTIFPPFMKKKQGVVSFAPDLCRSLGATYGGKTEYNGISVKIFTASLGDQSKNADEKCYCTTRDTCLKKGLMDLYKCLNMVVYVSLPHFYDSDESYLNGVKGLNPDPKKHGIKLLFELTTGSPLWARKRLQFNMPLEPNPKVDVFNNFTSTVLPIFWVEEGVSLNKTMTKPLKTLFTMKKVVCICSALIVVGSVGALGTAGYIFMTTDKSLQFIKKDGTRVKPADEDLNIDTILGTDNAGYTGEKF